MMKITVAIALCALISSSLSAQPFIEMAEVCGLHLADNNNGIGVADFDRDGDLDIYAVASDYYEANRERTWNRLFSNNGDGTFTDVAEEAGVRSRVTTEMSGMMGDKLGMAWGDYNNDGFDDLFLSSLGPDELYRNNGDGTFTDVTAEAGVEGDYEDYHSSSLWWDYDLDGDLDLYVGAWYGPNIFYENNGDGTFTDISAASGLQDFGHTWSAIPLDANNDLLPDFYVINDFGWKKFYVNMGDFTFQEATDVFNLADSGNGMGIALGDFDNNGYFDLYSTNIGGLPNPTPNPLFANNGDGTFTNRSIELEVDDAEWAWGTEFIDFDHDLDLDLAVVNGYTFDPSTNFLFENTLETGEVGFLDVSEEYEINGGFEARGLVTFDFDDDGDLDMLVSNWYEPPYLYRNDASDGNWLKVMLQGSTSNFNAYGSYVSITVGEHELYRSNDGVDFLGQSAIPLHFGLAAYEQVEELRVIWPDGSQETYFNIAANQEITIIEGSGIVGIDPEMPGTDPIISESFKLHQNYPNPFNPTTTIQYDVPVSTHIVLNVYDLSGRLVRALVNEVVSAGAHAVAWDGKDELLQPVTSGVYIYRLQTDQRVIQSQKMILIR